MTETTPPTLPPPPVSSRPAGSDHDDPTSSTALANPVALFLAAAAAATAAAIAVGGLIGFVVGSIAVDSCSPTDGWCELGAVIMGAFAGLVTGGIAYLITGITFVRRYRPAGRRAGPVVALVVAPPLTFATLGFLSELLSTIA